MAACRNGTVAAARRKPAKGPEPPADLQATAKATWDLLWAAAAGLPARRRVARVAPVPHGGRPPRRPFARRAIRPKARRLRQKAAVEPDPEVNVCGHRTRRDRTCETEMACPQANPTVHRPRRQPRGRAWPRCAPAP